MSAVRYALAAWARWRSTGDTAAAVVESLVRDGDVVVDAGADTGVFTLRLAQLVGPSGRVHAFEPNPARRPDLEEIAAARGNVVLHEAALSDRAGRARLHIPVRGSGPIGALGSMASRDDERCLVVEVACATLDEALGEDLPRVAFVKCDVEGHELAVLRGARRTLDASRAALLVEIEERHAGARPAETFALLEASGYAGQALGPEGLFPLDRFDADRHQAAHLAAETANGDMPAAYVNDFLFTASNGRRPSASSALATHVAAAGGA